MFMLVTDKSRLGAGLCTNWWPCLTTNKDISWYSLQMHSEIFRRKIRKQRV